jgi:hypothetical protein
LPLRLPPTDDLSVTRSPLLTHFPPAWEKRIRFETIEGIALRRIETTRCFAVACGLVLVSVLPAKPASGELYHLQQNWTEVQADPWRSLSQGSRLIPSTWLRALEQPGSTERFLEPAWIEEQFRYLPGEGEHGLPLGFVEDTSDDSGLSKSRLRWLSKQGTEEPWVGLTCAACHTTKITLGDATLRIDGGPTLADLQRFLDVLNRALVETRDDEASFDRFVANLKEIDPRTDSDLLRDAFVVYVDDQLEHARRNRTTMRYGFGRLDAVGYILNKVSFLANGRQGAALEPNAPVSYPHLWDINRLDRLQWNGMVESKPRRIFGRETIDGGAVGRDVAQAIGVFGDVNVERRSLVRGYDLRGFDSSIQVANIIRLERMLEQLAPPGWPDFFPTIRSDLRKEGEEIFASQCAGCHKGSMPGQEEDCVNVARIDIGRLATDPSSSCNAYSFHAASGKLAGHRSDYFYSDPIGEKAFLTDMLRVTSIGVMTAKLGQLLGQATSVLFDSDRPSRRTDCFDPPASHPPRPVEQGMLPPLERMEACRATQGGHIVYKARPLQGVWATGPYLHNGSVPTLYEMLLPASERSASFYVGTTEFDPVRVGLRTERDVFGNTFLFETRDSNGQPILGNSNAGHEHFRPDPGDTEEVEERKRLALLEFLKSL